MGCVLALLSLINTVLVFTVVHILLSPLVSVVAVAGMLEMLVAAVMMVTVGLMHCFTTSAIEERRVVKVVS